jgi:hypothetical protein
VAEVPFIACHTIVFAAPFYFLSGYRNSAESFLCFTLYHYLFNYWNCE